MASPSFSLSSSGSSSSGSRTFETPLTPPPPTTHDTSRTSYHISEIASFAESLQDAANQAFPNRGRSRYRTVNVCLIRWEADELQVQHELDRLRDVFEKLYGFNTETWLIPSSASQILLTSMTCSFLQKYDAEGNLFIVYYGGHGTINSSRQNQWWCSSQPGSPFVDWSAIQTLFGTANSDVLILLDCCAAASSAVGSGTGVMEAIAACGWETRAPPPGQYSFTHTLIEVLEDWVSKPSFSAAMLHTEILFVLKQKRPERGRDGRRLEYCSTPIHWVYTENPKAIGIEINCLKSASAVKKAPMREPALQQRSTTYIDPMDIDDEDESENPLTLCNANGEYQVPHVLISVALEGDQGTLDAASCRRWLADFPALVKYATIEGVYKGYSTLLTMSVPMMIWDLLPDNLACTFIGYVVSPNRYQRSSSMLEASTALTQMPLKRKLRSQSRRHVRDPFLSSCDSSYGSEYSPTREDSRPPFEIPFESDEEWDIRQHTTDEEFSSSWEEPLNYDSSTSKSEFVAFPRRDVPLDPLHGKSLITNLFHDTTKAEEPDINTPPATDPESQMSSTPPIDVPLEMRPKRYSSPSGAGSVLSPRSTRKNMLADELTESLRNHLLYERQTRARLAKLFCEDFDDLDVDADVEGDEGGNTRRQRQKQRERWSQSCSRSLGG